MTLANSFDLLFVTVLELAAGRPSNVLFMNVFDKSLSVLLLSVVDVVDAVDGRERGKMFYFVKNKTINSRFNGGAGNLTSMSGKEEETNLDE